MDNNKAITRLFLAGEMLPQEMTAFKEKVKTSSTMLDSVEAQASLRYHTEGGPQFAGIAIEAREQQVLGMMKMLNLKDIELNGGGTLHRTDYDVLLYTDKEKRERPPHALIHNQEAVKTNALRMASETLMPMAIEEMKNIILHAEDYPRMGVMDTPLIVNMNLIDQNANNLKVIIPTMISVNEEKLRVADDEGIQYPFYALTDESKIMVASDIITASRDRTEDIEAYLNNSMSKEERKAFEQELKDNPKLQEDLELSKSIIGEVKDKGMKEQIAQIGQLCEQAGLEYVPLTLRLPVAIDHGLFGANAVLSQATYAKGHITVFDNRYDAYNNKGGLDLMEIPEQKGKEVLDQLQEMLTDQNRQISVYVDTAKVPEWALPAIINGDYTNLDDKEVKQINDFLKEYPDHILSPRDDEPSFTRIPAFGKATDTIPVDIVRIATVKDLIAQHTAGTEIMAARDRFAALVHEIGKIDFEKPVNMKFPDDSSVYPVVRIKDVEKTGEKSYYGNDKPYLIEYKTEFGTNQMSPNWTVEMFDKMTEAIQENIDKRNLSETQKGKAETAQQPEKSITNAVIHTGRNGLYVRADIDGRMRNSKELSPKDTMKYREGGASAMELAKKYYAKEIKATKNNGLKR